MLKLKRRNQAFVASLYPLFILGIFALCFGSTGCAKKSWAGVPPEEIPSLAKDEFEIRKGMSRAQVEAMLGFPAEIGQTKEGNTLAQYTYGARVRSVVYDLNDAVVAAYPY